MTNWQNRIISTGEEQPDQLLANPANWRIHPKGQQEALEGVLSQVGWVQQVIVNKRTGNLVDGHLRVTLALRHNEKSIPVNYIDISPEEEALILATLDPIAGMAAADKDKLDALLRQVQSDDQRVQAMLAEIAADNGLKYGDEPPEDPGPQIDRAEELRAKWGVEPGQLWQLGEHRLICGDCTDRAVVDRVMGGESATICWTDPPYNVGYGEGFRGGESALGWKKRTIENDNLGDAFYPFIESAFKSIWSASIPGGILYMCMSAQEWPYVDSIIREIGFHWSSTIIWAKDSLVVGRKDYHTQYEPVWYGWRSGAARVRKVENRKQTDLWVINRPKRSDEHPTMKPVELVERSLNNSSIKGDVVLDPFLGSGTTLIACERLGRRCRAIEISPAYCAVAIQRWVDMTGGEPKLLEPGCDQCFDCFLE